MKIVSDGSRTQQKSTMSSDGISMAIAAAKNIMILVMLKLIGKQRPVQLTVGFVDRVTTR